MTKRSMRRRIRKLEAIVNHLLERTDELHGVVYGPAEVTEANIEYLSATPPDPRAN